MIGSWAIVQRVPSDDLEALILAIPGVVKKKDNVPLFHGTLDDFAKLWDAPFVASYKGFYIEVIHPAWEEKL